MKDKYCKYCISILGGEVRAYYLICYPGLVFDWLKLDSLLRSKTSKPGVKPFLNEKYSMVAINLSHISTMEQGEADYEWNEKYQAFERPEK